MKRWLIILSAVCCALCFSSCFNNPVSSEKKVVPLTGNEIDSLFALLISRVEVLEQQESYDAVYAIDFAGISAGFTRAIKGSPYDVKANVGFVMAKLLSLNGNAGVKKMVDSLEVYFDSLDAYGSTPAEPASADTFAIPKRASGLLSSAYDKGGILSLGKAMTVMSPEMVMASSQPPKFPRFITMSYIQNIITRDVMPALDSAIEAEMRLESLASPSLLITIDNETREVDLTDILTIEAGMRLTRAWMGMLTAYDEDLFTSATDQTYSWIDNMFDESDNTGRYIYRLSGDTLWQVYVTKNNTTAITADVYRANLNRTGFMKIKRQNHAKAWADLQAVPAKMKAAITALRNEADNQDDDLIPLSVLTDADNQMRDLPRQITDAGFPDSIAAKFQTPESFMNYLTTLLGGPYRLHDSIGGANIDITMNISAWFTDPVQDLTTLWPKYRVTSTAEQWQASYSDYVYNSYSPGNGTTYFFISSGDSIAIPASMIDSMDTSYGGGMVWLKDSIYWEIERDSTISAMPVLLVDDQGADLTTQRMQQLIEDKQFFPYFTDYTFHNVFPGMTRQKWLDMIWQ